MDQGGVCAVAGGVGARLDGGVEVTEERETGGCYGEGAELLPLVEGVIKLFCCCQGTEIPGFGERDA